MKFAVKMVSKQSGRLGILSKVNVEIKTPFLMHYTKSGSVPHLSREVFDMISTEQQIAQISIETTYLMTEVTKLMEKGISAFVGLDSTLSCVTLRDTGTSMQPFHSRDSVSILTRNGKVQITPQKYMETIEAFNPDMFHTLCDGDTNEESGNKRNTNAIQRTKFFFYECADKYKTLTSLSDSLLLAPVAGGYSPHHRQEMINDLNNYANQDIIGGYFLDGFHANGESAMKVNNSAVCDIVRKCNELLPQNKLKVMFGGYSPKMLLELIQLNVDLFDTTYPYLAASKHKALTFNFYLDGTLPEQNDFQINLSDAIYKDDFEPFVKNCTCYACQNHTKAYVQHLTNTRELLGPILLMIHNTHHYMEFFKAIRKCIANDTLPNLINLIGEQQSKYEMIKMQEDQKQNESEIVQNVLNKRASKKI